MTDAFVARFLRGVAGVGLGTSIQITLGFFAFLLGARWLPPEQFGAFILLQVVNFFFLAVADVLLQKTAVTQFLVAEPEPGKPRIVFVSLTYRIVTGFGLSAVLLGALPLAAHVFRSPELWRLAPLAPAFFLLSSLDELLFAVLQGLHRYRQIALAQVLTGTARLALVVVLLATLRTGVMGLVWAFVASLAVSVSVQWLGVGLKPKVNFDRATYARLMRFGLPLGANNTLTFFFSKLDRFLLGWMMGPSGVAAYEVAARIPDNLQRLYQAFQSVFFPNVSELFSRNRRDEAEAVLNHSIRLLSFASMSAALFVLLFRDALTRLLYSGAYAGSALAFAILMVSLNMAVSGNLMGTALVAAGRSDRPIRISVVMAATSLGGNLLLIPRLGVVGAACAAVAANYCTNLTVSVWYLHREHVRIWWGPFVKPIALFGACASFVLLVQPVGTTVKIVTLLVFILCGIPLRLFAGSDLARAAGIIRPRDAYAAPASGVGAA